jgi:hypothetical protein
VSEEGMFAPEYRARVRDRVLELARADKRITGGALTGSATAGAEDRFSDIDLSFGVAEGNDPERVLDEWTEQLASELEVVHWWDLPHAGTIYRVYLLPGGLELDIAVTPAANFGPRGPKFRRVFGEVAEVAKSRPASFEDLVGYGWMLALTGRASIERGRLWQGAHWIDEVRDRALTLACLRLGEPTDHGRGFDRLPAEITAPYEDSLVGSLEANELRRALAVVTELFLREVAATDPELAGRLRDQALGSVAAASYG